MKRISFAPVLIVSTVLLTTVITQSTKAEDTSFFCGTSNGNLATIARTNNIEIPIVFWDSPDLVKSNDSPQELCNQVSEKLQNYYSRGELNYITTGSDCPGGIDSCQIFVCVAQTEEEGCRGRLLFAIQLADSYDTPQKALQRILRTRVPYERGIDETSSSLYVDLDKYLQGDYPSEQ